MHVISFGGFYDTSDEAARRACHELNNYLDRYDVKPEQIVTLSTVCSSVYIPSENAVRTDYVITLLLK